MKRRNVLKIAAAASTSAGAGLLVVGKDSGASGASGAATGQVAPAAAGVGEGSGELMPGMKGMAGLPGLPAAGAVTPPPAVLTPFVDAMPRLVDAVPVSTTADTDHYATSIENSYVQLAPGKPTAVTSYGGGFIGPLIRAQRGRKVSVTYTNNLSASVVVHLHGGHVPSPSDGFPTDELAAGASRTYTYPNLQRGATLWYHDHLHMMEAVNVYNGLHGVYILHDPAEDVLDLPGGRYDVPIFLRDAYLDVDNTLYYDPTLTWTALLANGKARPYFPVGQRQYRFRLINGSNHRTLTLSLSDGTPLVQIAGDGGLLPAPSVAPQLALSSAERGEVLVDFSGYPMGTQLYLEDSVLGQILRFDVTETCPPEPRKAALPATLAALPALKHPTNTRDITLSLSADTNYFYINGKVFDPNVVMASIPVGTTEIWQVTDISGWEHNFHIHLVQFRVLDINGAPPGPSMQGLKDTVPIPANGTVRLQATFSDYPGKYVFHCHLLEHASFTGMMARMDITA
ncbi:multicopper oxidase family protein [Catenulispora rubra]|uniref:multicopper oxidase family protein n=1 Tax=Catenulispora rubra TaxID=280293 RepID=UPI001891FCC7|nr:multicopper oxidase family protein [Catenulispora rubra]